MDLLKSYESDESSSEEPGKSLSEDSLLRSHLHSVYLVTYSQADITKFPTRENFTSAVVYAFFFNCKAKGELFSGVAVGRNIRTVVNIIISR